MAGPNGDDHSPGKGKQTGTRPKSRSNTATSRHASLSSAGGGGQQQALVSLMREYQAVSESLAAARDQIEREGARVGAARRRHNVAVVKQRSNSNVNTGQSNEDRLREMELLRSRLLELEMEMSTSNSDHDGQNMGFNVSMDSDNFFRFSNDSEDMERNLALLTAQYEKTSQEEDTLELSPGHLMANNSLEPGPGPDPGLDKSRDHLDLMPPAMAILNNSSDTVKLARELKYKRDQLEELMKKTVISSGVNESGSGGAGGGRVKDNNRSVAGAAVSGSSGARERTAAVTNPGQELARLQDQVAKLKQELERLSVGPSCEQPAAAVTVPQLSQLSVSINQLYSGLWSLQREVATLTDRMAAMEQRTEAGARRDSVPSSREEPQPWRQNNYNLSAPHSLRESDWAERAPDPVPAVQPPAWDPHHHFSPYPSRDLWNSLQASPGFNNPLHIGVFPTNFHIAETDSGVSCGALNNQVSPGVRANNYYDNFRSFSRQNRLSGPLPASAGLGLGGVAGGGHPDLQQANAEPNNVNNSGTRPRRVKHKINREQNRDSSARAPPAAAEQSNLRRRAEGANPVLAANTYTSPTTDTASAADSLAKNIYSQVGAFIQQNDQAPELLARLLQDLTMLGQQQDNTRNNMNIDTLDTSSFTSEDTRDSDNIRHVRERASQSRSKVSGKRLTLGSQSRFSSTSAAPPRPTLQSESNILSGAGAMWPQPWVAASPPGVAAAVPKNQQKNLISRERDSISRKMPGWRDRLLPRNMQPGQDRDHEAAGDQEGFINIQLELPEDRQDPVVAGAGHARQDSASVVSVSDMAETEDLAEADQSHDATPQMWAESRDSGGVVSPAPARDSYLPEGVFPVRDSDSPPHAAAVAGPGPGQHHQGLDRVPIRLQSSAASSASQGGWAGLGRAASERMEARRLEEEEAVTSILEEVLASSPEMANTEESNMPPSP